MAEEYEIPEAPLQKTLRISPTTFQTAEMGAPIEWRRIAATVAQSASGLPKASPGANVNGTLPGTVFNAMFS